ncbi:MAG TPA: disulfide oxidoreductase [Candidatus Dormibacteraeota bacterium]|nr:disulfide oxidoreductase [Candidatus Dormibacteraeota bacterium]
MVKRQPNETILLLIWIQALIATVGSLFYSEVMGYVPCDLCWIQRIFMYPLVIIYGIAALKKDLSVALPGVILSGMGLCVSVYHYGLQKLPLLQDAGGFCSTVSCNLQYVNYFGFITIPFLAGTAFLVILTLHIVLWRQMREEK